MEEDFQIRLARYRRVAHLLSVAQRQQFRARFAQERREIAILAASHWQERGNYFASPAFARAAALLAIRKAQHLAPAVASAVSTVLRRS